MLPLPCRLLTLLLLVLPIDASLAEQTGARDRGAQTIVHLLDYVSAEYPQFVQAGNVIDQREYAEQVEFAHQIKDEIEALPDAPKREAYVRQAGQLLALIQTKGDGARVAVLARELQRGLITAYNVPVSPRHAPDLAGAAALYAAHCAACHGMDGDGKGPQAAQLSPAPANFRDVKRQSGRSVFGLFNTISLGVDGTPMAAFSDLSAEDRWKLAFYVSRFTASDAQRARGAEAWKRGEGRALFSALPALVTMTPAEAHQQGADAESILAYLRAEPTQLEPSAGSPIAFSLATLERSLAAYRAGNAQEAYRLAVTAYLEGFELIEASLDNRDRELRTRTEAAMMGYRDAIKAGRSVAEVEAGYDAAAKLLEESQRRLAGPTASPTADFVSS
ncbi:MAG TPA: cytochrome c, partial [Burkholderiales bacterium]|nr:cytochrome c [Burkholderiales bacterium]